MRAVIQRVSSASVTIDHVVTGSISQGLLIFVAVQHGDDTADALWLANKITSLRVFADEEGRMNRSLKELVTSTHPATAARRENARLAGALVVSQFTLLAETSKGSRPSFNAAAKPDVARPLYEHFVQCVQASLGSPVATGAFGADMKVALVNDGPVTIVLNSPMRA